MESPWYGQAVPLQFYFAGWLIFGLVLGYLFAQEIPYLLTLWSRLCSVWSHPAPESPNMPHESKHLATQLDPIGNRWAVNRPRRHARGTSSVAQSTVQST
jgi:hypothetical protein